MKTTPVIAAIFLSAALIVGCENIPVAPDTEMLAVEEGSANKKSQTGPKTDQSGNCDIGVDVVLHTSTTAGLIAVLLGDAVGNFYSNGFEKVTAGSGHGDGFRFDTNGSQQTETARDKRRISLAFDTVDINGDGLGDGLDLNADGTNEGTIISGADFRFTGSLLDLCGIPELGSGTVPISMGFQYQDAPMSIQWGCALTSDGPQTTATASVTRLANLASGKRQWVIEGNEGCVKRGWQFQNAPFYTGSLPFSMTITEQ